MDRSLAPAEIIESTIEDYSSGLMDCSTARKRIRHTLLQLAEMPDDTSLSFSNIFERLATTTSLPRIKEFSTLTIRLVSCNGLLPESIERSANRHLVKLIEQGNDTITEILPDGKKSLNHARLAAYARFHSDACQSLQILIQPISGLHDLVGRRQSLMQTLNHGHLKSYLNPLGFQAPITSVNSILKLVDQTDKSHGRELQTNLQNLLETVSEEIDQLELNPVFLLDTLFCLFCVMFKWQSTCIDLTWQKNSIASLLHPPTFTRYQRNIPCMLSISRSSSTSPWRKQDQAWPSTYALAVSRTIARSLLTIPISGTSTQTHSS